MLISKQGLQKAWEDKLPPNLSQEKSSQFWFNKAQMM
jgi:hypothetical protein